MDTSSLSDIDTYRVSYGEGRVAFCARYGSHYIDVIAIILHDDGTFSVGSSSCCPRADAVFDFTAAWARCSTFIVANGLVART